MGAVSRWDTIVFVFMYAAWTAVRHRCTAESQCEQIGAAQAPKMGNAWHRVRHVEQNASVAGQHLTERSSSCPLSVYDALSQAEYISASFFARQEPCGLVVGVCSRNVYRDGYTVHCDISIAHCPWRYICTLSYVSILPMRPLSTCISQTKLGIKTSDETTKGVSTYPTNSNPPR